MGTGYENPRLKIGDRDNFQNGSNSHLFQHGKVSMSAKFHAFITICKVQFIIRCTNSKQPGDYFQIKFPAECISKLLEDSTN